MSSEKVIEAYEKGLRTLYKRNQKEHEAKGVKQWNVFRAGEVGECMAKLTRDWNTDKQRVKDIPIEAIQNMFFGTSLHHSVRPVLKTGGLNIHGEEKMFKKTWLVKGTSITIIGHVDNLVNNEFVLDLKKSERFSFENIQRYGLPDTYHDQMLAYLMLTGKKYGVVFVIGTHGKKLTFEVDYSKSKEKDILERLREVALLRKVNKIGEREYEYGLPPCSWCPHSEACWSVKSVINSKKKEQYLERTDPDYDKLKAIIMAKKELDEYSKRAEDAKSSLNTLSRKLIIDRKAKKLRCDRGSATVVVFKRTGIRILDEEKAIKKGVAEKTSSDVEYIRVNVLGEDTDDE